MNGDNADENEEYREEEYEDKNDHEDEQFEENFADKERINIGLASETDQFNDALKAVIAKYGYNDHQSMVDTIGLCGKIPDIRSKNLDMLILSLRALTNSVPQNIKVNELDDLVSTFRTNTINLKNKSATDNDVKIALIRYARLWINVGTNEQ